MKVNEEYGGSGGGMKVNKGVWRDMKVSEGKWRSMEGHECV